MLSVNEGIQVVTACCHLSYHSTTNRLDFYLATIAVTSTSHRLTNIVRK